MKSQIIILILSCFVSASDNSIYYKIYSCNFNIKIVNEVIESLNNEDQKQAILMDYYYNAWGKVKAEDYYSNLEKDKVGEFTEAVNISISIFDQYYNGPFDNDFSVSKEFNSESRLNLMFGGRYSRLRSILKNDIYKDNYYAQDLYGFLLYVMEEYDELIDHYKSIISINPYHPSFFVRVLLGDLHLNKLEDFKIVYKAAKEKFPDYPLKEELTIYIENEKLNVNPDLLFDE